MPLAIVAVVLIAATVGFFMFTQTDSSDTSTREVTEETATLPEVVSNEPEPEDDEEPEPTPAPSFDPTPSEPVVTTPEPAPAPAPAPVTANEFTNGSYTASASYFTPARKEHDIVITLGVTDDVVTSAAITYDGGTAQTGSHKRFDDAYQAAVVGVALDQLNLSRVGGASLTSDAFNEALVGIKSQAAS